MVDLVTLVNTFGPITGLILFMIWKQLQIGNTKPLLISIESKIDEILKKLGNDDE